MNRLEKITKLANEIDVDAVLLTNEINIQYATLYSKLEGMVIIDRKNRGVCFTDSRYIEDATNRLTPLGYEVIESDGSYPMFQMIRRYVEDNGIKKIAYENSRISAREYENYKQQIKIEWVPLNDSIEDIRSIKETIEVEWILEAQRIAERGLEKLLPEIKIGMYEDELATMLRYYMALEGSESFCQGMTLVSGKTTSLPHGVPLHKKLETGEFLTIDFGAQYNGYHSDMTRTFAIGKVNEEKKKIYNIVKKAQLAGIEAYEIGKMGKEVDFAAREVIENAGYGLFFGHGLGHSIGLEVHENPRANKVCESIFREGSVITIEPGIYIPGKFGVRIEDTIYLSRNGKINLTNFSKDLIEVG